jgi:aldose 1-epimerase
VSALSQPILSRGDTGRITQREFGRLPDGRVVLETTLDQGEGGLALSVINWGAAVTALQVPDRQGRRTNVVLAWPHLADYVERPQAYLGVIVGPYANRIANGEFSLDGVLYTLERDPGARHILHGGPQGLGRRFWRVEPQPVDATSGGRLAVTLHCTSADGTGVNGTGGFPGRLDVAVTYSLTRQGEWRIDYRARTSRPTVINLSQHSYFNLAGQGSALDQVLMLNASRVSELDDGLIPTGWASVAGTPFDFRQAQPIGERLHDAHPQLAIGHGYDHCWLLDSSGAAGSMPDGLTRAARLCDPGSGRVMDIHTSEPAIQFYSGWFLADATGDARPDATPAHPRGAGICLETQHPPDAPNQPRPPEFENSPGSAISSVVLRPGELFRSTTVHQFSLVPPSQPEGATP